ncbi:MAG: hypothetical protein ACKVJK_03160 [Methylophagaceae bacterium]|jgi:hypothetical protein|tara:strand:- start:15654 stop:16340 length:687 start_codon:yes stop_codon:yes gene_type:complete
MAIEYRSLFEEAERVAKGKSKGVSVFSDILAKGIRKGEVPARSTTARTWYRNAAKSVTKTGTGSSGVSGAAMIQTAAQERGRLVSNMEPGDMYTFAYNPKHKATLPYYDRFPLIFPINKVKGGFLGINFHYLPPMMRGQLMDALYTVTSNKTFDETTKLQVSYELLQSAARFRFFKPALKMYLNKQMQSKFVYINPTEWDIALFLPLARFEGANKQKVYADSRKTIQG